VGRGQGEKNLNLGKEGFVLEKAARLSLCRPNDHIMCLFSEADKGNGKDDSGNEKLEQKEG